MTTPSKTLQVWVHSFCPDNNMHLETVISSLNRHRVTTNVLQPDEARGPGIIILADVAPEVCEFVRTVSRHGRERILVLAADEAAVADGSAWEILQAGASDILVRSDISDPGADIVAKLRRWQAVDELVEAPLIRNHLVGQSRAWKSVLRRVVEVARFTDSPVLLVGETGTGKELTARLIHTLDRKRNERELVILDCTTIVPDLSGSELFGHERGAFTGAVAARDGAFALADGGTLFLDEVGELPLELQVQLLRVLEERTYKRVGSSNWQSTDFRLICATNRDMQLEERQGRFRRDLYYRITTWTIRLPPLRERVKDIIPLVHHFIQQACPGEEPPGLDPRVQKYFLTRDYPGNVRDLRNLVHRVVARHVGSGPITIGDIPRDERPARRVGLRDWCDRPVKQAIRRGISAGATLKEIRQEIEDVAIQVAVDEYGNLQRAADALGVTDRTLQKRRAEQRQRAQTLMDDNIAQ